MTEPTTRKTPQKPPEVVDLVAESQKLRGLLERAALDGTLDLKDKHVAMHQRLDDLERVIYAARRQPPGTEKSAEKSTEKKS